MAQSSNSQQLQGGFPKLDPYKKILRYAYQDANIYNYRLSEMRNHQKDLFRKAAIEKAELEREQLKNLQSSSFLHKSYSTHTGYVYFNQINQISSNLTQNDLKQQQLDLMDRQGAISEETAKRQ